MAISNKKLIITRIFSSFFRRFSLPLARKVEVIGDKFPWFAKCFLILPARFLHKLEQKAESSCKDFEIVELCDTEAKELGAELFAEALIFLTLVYFISKDRKLKARSMENQLLREKQNVNAKIDDLFKKMRNIDRRLQNLHQQIMKDTGLKHDVSISSPESQRFQHRVRSCECSSASEDDRNKTDTNHDNTCTAECSSCEKPSTCCCSNDHAQILHFEDEYISLKIEDCDAAADAAARDEALRKARRKRRRRRKRKMKKRLAMGQIVDVEAVHHNFKDYDEDDLPQPAKWTIVVTACLLLFMCLLLVGITLRMAPIIDEMVRKEYDEVLQKLQEGYNSTTSVQEHL